MEFGTNIRIPGIRGAQALDCTLPDSENNRRVKVYIVPETVSPDRYYVSITMTGADEQVPPSRGKDTLLLADYFLSGTGETTINYINEEVLNA